MIISRKMKNEDTKEVLEIIEKGLYSNSNSDVIYIIKDNNEINGVCGISSYNDFGTLDYIIIKEKFRGKDLGDGLIRATFNYCLRKGLLQIYFLGYSEYLLKKGFMETNEEKIDFNVSNSTKNNKILICDLPDFFSKKCCK
ncbi:GNAT family N-acetyltransferase [Dethiothermospora halolimnae]|uniref:GNAT family N-acetyltransferase n=1 Tax=Dethiothermospora halolimnae TaxID=3114390 RepID=UPI003CCBAB83